jgi:hypothetical protein
MAYEMKPGQGSLFKNDKKTSDNHPNLKGKIMLPNGEVRWMSAWTKTTTAGEKWISLNVGELVQQAGGSGYAQAVPVAKPVDLDDDIPF